MPFPPVASLCSLRSKPLNPRPDALSHIPELLRPPAQLDADVRPGLDLQSAAEGLLDLVVADLTETPVDGQGGAGAGAGGDVEGEVVEDAAELGAVVDGRRVEPGDGEGHGKGGEEGEGRGRGEQVHRGVVDEAWRVVGIVRVVGLVVMVGVFGGMQAWGGDCDLESGERGAETGLAGDGSGMGAEREGCVVTFWG